MIRENINKSISRKLGILGAVIIALLILTSNFIMIEVKQHKDYENITDDEKIDENIENSKMLEDEEIKAKVNQNLAKMKGFFTQNCGQLENDEIYFTYSCLDKTFGFTENSVFVKLSKTLEDNTTKSSVIKIIYEGANKVIPVGKEELEHKSNYFIGNDSTKWSSNVQNFEKIVYENLYDGIDLVYYFSEKGLKYDWVVKAGADPSQIVERFEGIDSLKICSDGGLIVKTEGGELKEEMPYSYQKIKDKTIKVDVNFRSVGENMLIYNIGNYETSEDLIIDPLIYSTFVGGDGRDVSNSIVLDSENNAYITGRTSSSDFPTTFGCCDESYNGATDVFVCKLNKNGSELIYSTFVGGSDGDWRANIALDYDINAYVTGITSSSDFPTTSGCFDYSHNGGNYDLFVFKLSSDGSNLVYSTYIGGEDYDYCGDIALDFENNAYITGQTYSSDFPTSVGCYDDELDGNTDALVFKLNKDGTDLVYSTYVGGDYDDSGSDIAIDSENNAYVVGLRVTDAFVFKLNFDGSDLVYSTRVGGGYGTGITLDSENNAYITGDTTLSNFPTTSGCYDDSYNGGRDAFVCKLNHNGSKLLYSTYVGGSNAEYGYSIILDSENNAYITGSTTSSDFPTTSGCYDDTYNGERDIFVCKLSSEGSNLLYSTFVGGTDDEGCWEKIGIALDCENNPYITGGTQSSDFPTTSGCYDDSHNGNQDVFIFKLNLSSENKKPTINITKPEEGEEINGTYTIEGTAKDEDGEVQKVEIKIDDEEWKEVEGTNNWSYELDNTEVVDGEHTIYARAFDSEDYSKIDVVNVPVKNVNKKPTAIIDSISPNPANKGEEVLFYGNGTDEDGTIEEYRWDSNLDGFFSSEKSFSFSDLSNRTHTLYFKVKDNNDTWSDEVNAILTINGIPRAKIDEIKPNPAYESETVYFNGNYIDFENDITEFYWKSDKVGKISNKQNFSISSLSNGTHKITFRVKDNFGVWSENVSNILTINGIPNAIIDEITPNLANKKEKITFHGNYTDFENNITEFYWESNIDKILSDREDFSISNLSNGTHKITFRVKDSFGVWSENVTETLTINGIPKAKIDEITPNSINENEKVTFHGNYIDFENNIKEFYWKSNINGFLSNKKDFSLFNLSNGTHIISLKVQDNFGVWSDIITETLRINGIPSAKINSISQNPAIESEKVTFSGNYTDYENNITEFYWESNLDNFLSNKISFSLTNLSVGIHTISFRVKDNFGVRSIPVEMKLEIKKKEESPKLKILEIIQQESALENQNITIETKIKNMGNISISNFSVIFYYDNKEIKRIKYEKILEPNQEDTIKITWQAVLGNHTIKVKLETTNGTILDEKESDQKIEVVKEWEGEEKKEESNKIIYIIPILIVVICIIGFFMFKKRSS